MAITVKKRTVNLAHYYPNTVYPSKEFQTLANIGDDELNKIWSEAWQLMLNTFVYDLNELGASRWEEMLNLYPAPDDTLEMRKQAILFKINNKLPYTERSFQNMVDGIYGVGKVKIIIEHDEYNIRFELEPDVMKYYSGLWKYSRVVVPANMGIYAIVRNAMTCSIYFGAKMLRVGRKVIGIKSPEKATSGIYSGVAYYKGGRKKLRLKEPIRPYSAINLGSLTIKIGRKTIPCRGKKEEGFKPPEKVTSGIYIGVAYYKGGRKKLKLKEPIRPHSGIYIGVAYYKGGRKKLKLKEPEKATSGINLGSLTIKIGRKTIPCREEDIK